MDDGIPPEAVAAVHLVARSALSRDLADQIEARFYRQPSAILGLLWAMAHHAKSTSEPGLRWGEITDGLMEARRAAAKLE